MGHLDLLKDNPCISPECLEQSVKDYAEDVYALKNGSRRGIFLAEINHPKKWGGKLGEEKNISRYVYQSRFLDFLTGLQEFVSKEITPETNMLEIGSYAGCAARLFASYCKHLTVIDPWDINGPKDLREEGYSFIHSMSYAEKFFNLNTKDLPVTKIKAYDQDVADSFQNESFDLIYIDAVHTKAELTRQIELWMPKVKKGGKMGGHDYYTAPLYDHFCPEVQVTVDHYFPEARKYKDSSWVADL